ncbi:MAG TPA: hypothetical protein VG407_03345 [Caulobacteraceae bacterium]|jgi:hypothetical protein|nr:hypothetical protein [Caulobacteraceae bacterium]
MGWTIAIGILLILVILLFAPIEARATLERRMRYTLSVSWLGLRFVHIDSARPKPPKPKTQASPKAPGKKVKWTRFANLRSGRAALKVAKDIRIRSFAWRTARRCTRAVELVKAHFVVTAGLGDPILMGLAAGMMSYVRPGLHAWDGRVRLEFEPDFGRRWHVEGEVLLYTRPAWWLYIGCTVLLSRTFWRALKMWKVESRAKPK